MEHEANVEFAEVCVALDVWVGCILAALYLDGDGEHENVMFMYDRRFLLAGPGFWHQTGHNGFMRIVRENPWFLSL